jgi:hypothetical protein
MLTINAANVAAATKPSFGPSVRISAATHNHEISMKTAVKVMHRGHLPNALSIQTLKEFMDMGQLFQRSSMRAMYLDQMDLGGVRTYQLLIGAG